MSSPEFPVPYKYFYPREQAEYPGVQSEIAEGVEEIQEKAARSRLCCRPDRLLLDGCLAGHRMRYSGAEINDWRGLRSGRWARYLENAPKLHSLKAKTYFSIWRFQKIEKTSKRTLCETSGEVQFAA
jgi:hypothetical protein